MKIAIQSSTFCVLALYLHCSIAYVPGQLRRRLVGSPKRRLNTSAEGSYAILSTLEKETLRDALPDITLAIRKTLKSVSPFSSNQAAFVDKNKIEIDREVVEELDCLAAQRETKQGKIPSFLHKITPSDVSIDPTDREAQEKWFRDNAASIQSLKEVHGGIFLQGWDLLKDEEGLDAACEALGVNPCRDPGEIIDPRPGLRTEKQRIFEASNDPIDASTHIGLHHEAEPGFMPKSAFFACFKAADEGGEFLLCDGRRILRDIATDTLATLQSKKMTAVFAEFPSWLSSAPGPLKHLPGANRVHHELMSLFTDLNTPTNEYVTSLIPSTNLDERSEPKLALTSTAGSPIIRHHETGEPIWFNNIDAAHRGLFQKRNPNSDKRGKFSTEVFNMVYGDFGSISGKVLDDIVSAMERNTKEITMKPGDGVFLDNWITLHGRKPFSGERKHAVVWSSN